MRFLVLTAALAASMPLAASAQVSVNINLPGVIAVAPPAPRYEPVPAPRSGQVWIQGNWYWTNNNYAWRPGRWEHARPDYDYAPGRWVRADGLSLGRGRLEAPRRPRPWPRPRPLPAGTGKKRALLSSAPGHE